MMFADDTVIYYAHKSAEEIEKVLNKELELMSLYFSHNDLIVNLKKGKTEYMSLRYQQTTFQFTKNFKPKLWIHESQLRGNL